MTNKYIDWIEKQAKASPIVEDNHGGAFVGGVAGGFYGLGKAEKHIGHNKVLNRLANSSSKLKRVGGKGAQVLGAAAGVLTGTYFGNHLGAGVSEGLKQSFGKKSKN